MQTTVRKKDFFKGRNCSQNFLKFLELIDDEIKIIEFPRVTYHENNMITPLVLSYLNYRIKKPKQIAEELVSILRNFKTWKSKTRSDHLIWFYSIDGKILHHLLVFNFDQGKTTRIHVSDGQDSNGLFWVWKYPHYYDYTS